ncbi:MAG: hypothetical protein U0586_03125 [Candidatus Brocadiaceae bacterium]
MVTDKNALFGKRLSSYGVSGKISSFVFLSVVLVSVVVYGVTFAKDSEDMGKIQSYSGDVWIQREGVLLDTKTSSLSSFRKAGGFPFLQDGDSVITGKLGGIKIVLEDKAKVDVGEQTSLRFYRTNRSEKGEVRVFELREGRIVANLAKTGFVATEIEVNGQRIILDRPAKIDVSAKSSEVVFRVEQGSPRFVYIRTGQSFELSAGQSVTIPRNQGVFSVAVGGKRPFEMKSEDGTVLRVDSGGEALVQLDGYNASITTMKKEGMLVLSNGVEQGIWTASLSLSDQHKTTIASAATERPTGRTTATTVSTTTTTLPTIPSAVPSLVPATIHGGGTTSTTLFTTTTSTVVTTTTTGTIRGGGTTTTTEPPVS